MRSTNLAYKIILFVFVGNGVLAYGQDISKLSQVELKNALKSAPRCNLKLTDDGSKDSSAPKAMKMIIAPTEDGGNAYFVEIKSGDQSTIVYLPKTGITLGGYQMAASTGVIGFKSTYKASANYLSQMSGGKGQDVTLKVSKGAFGKVNSFYSYCENPGGTQASTGKNEAATPSAPPPVNDQGAAVTENPGP